MGFPSPLPFPFSSSSLRIVFGLCPSFLDTWYQHGIALLLLGLLPLPSPLPFVASWSFAAALGSAEAAVGPSLSPCRHHRHNREGRQAVLCLLPTADFHHRNNPFPPMRAPGTIMQCDFIIGSLNTENYDQRTPTALGQEGWNC